MLTALEVENFKGIGRAVRIDLRPITLLFGPNSAGKSAILHALHYAHEILSRRNFDPDETHHSGDAVNLGGFQNFVHGRDLNRPLRLAFEMDLQGAELPDLRPPPASLWRSVSGSPEDFEGFNDGLADLISSASIEVELQWSMALRRPVVRVFAVRVNGADAARIEASADGASVELCGVNFRNPIFSYDGRGAEASEQLDLVFEELSAEQYQELFEVRVGVRNLERGALPAWGEGLDIDVEWDDTVNVDYWQYFGYSPRELISRVSVLLVGIGEILSDELAQMRYVGPMRDVLARSYAAPRYLESRRWASGLGAWDRMSTRGPEFVRRVSDWLSDPEKLDTGYGLELKSSLELPEDSALWLSIERGTFLDMWDDLAGEFRALETRRELRLVDPASRMAVHPSDVGVGVSQVVPVVVAAIDPERPSLTAIEQPELHIHPKVQVGLGDLFASQIGDGSCSFLLETHSEHLMLRLLRRIEETYSDDLPPGAPALRPDQVAVVFVEQIEGEVRATQLRIDESGEFIDRWPHGFFEERADELI